MNNFVIRGIPYFGDENICRGHKYNDYMRAYSKSAVFHRACSDAVKAVQRDCEKV